MSVLHLNTTRRPRTLHPSLHSSPTYRTRTVLMQCQSGTPTKSAHPHIDTVTSTTTASMVFRDLKRAPRPRLIIKITGILDLPAELLVQIFANDLSTLDILRLRVSHSSFTPVCTSWLAEHLTRLYIHPNAVSMKCVLEICAHPLFAAEVQEIVLLGDVRWTNIDRKTRKHMTGDEWVSGKFRPWPLVFPTGRPEEDRARSAAAEASAVVPVFGEAYAPLIQALEKLPKLRMISHAGSGLGPGWNQTKQNAIWTFARRQSEEPVQSENKTKPKPNVRIRTRADAEVLIGLLSCPALPVFTELVLKNGLPTSAGQLQMLSTTERLANLETMELHSDSFWAPSTNRHTFAHNLLANATRLQHLKLVYTPNSYIKNAQRDNSFAALLHTSSGDMLHWPALKSFVVLSPQLPDTDRNVYRGPAPPIPSSRPLCHSLDIAGFVKAHANTLEIVELRNSLFCSARERPTACLHEGVKALNACEKLREVTWTVSKFGHHKECLDNRRGSSSFNSCARRFDCGVYYRDMAGYVVEMAGEMEGAAHTLGVDLDEKGRVWDFGDAVRVGL
ncbi:hypothetical protein LTR48_004326 [Friedmanniomyces endolithicus]|uniref:F-box domain-containing protein n=1 Tax=Rachicladosporium monterosium TaxID=1507873 RepID=A0ABR0L5H7_9PEZI|nr:hypothetical protein LTR29_013616 [Friedmanniomyces endolithicus]KAK1085660.1 hypothetical protein LTR48_004326 [Friedmanniomyces endolithicus]KAK5143837.1 hypothetical protein LTR32_004113 [Rachicladosporium monterosium]